MLQAAHHWLIVALILTVIVSRVSAEDPKKIEERNKRVQNLVNVNARFVFDSKDKTRPPTQVELTLPKEPKKRDVALADLAGLTTLQSVTLGIAKDSDLVGLTTLTNLTSLSTIRGSIDITDAAFDSITQFHKLEALNLENTTVSAKGLASLSTLKKLNRLTLARTPTSDEGLKTLKDVKQLRHLNVESTNVTAEGLKHLGKLESIWLGGDKIGDAAVAEVARCETLRFLSITHERTAVTDAGLRYLEDLPSLRSLQIYCRQVTPNGIAALQRKKPKLLINR